MKKKTAIGAVLCALALMLSGCSVASSRSSGADASFSVTKDGETAVYSYSFDDGGISEAEESETAPAGESRDPVQLDADYKVENGLLNFHLTSPSGYVWTYATPSECVALVNQVTNGGKYHVSISPVSDGTQAVTMKMLLGAQVVQYFMCNVTVSKGAFSEVTDAAFYEVEEVDVPPEEPEFPLFSYVNENDPLETAVVNNTLIFRDRYPDGDIAIPAVYIAAIDDLDPGNVTVYGQFYVFVFNQEEQSLRLISGGADTGLMRFAEAEDGTYGLTYFNVTDQGDTDGILKTIGGGDRLLEMLTENHTDEIADQVVLYLSAYVNSSGIDADRFIDASGKDVPLLSSDNLNS